MSNYLAAARELQREAADWAEQRSRYYMDAVERSLDDYRETGLETYLHNAKVLSFQSDNWLRRATTIRSMTPEAFAMWLAQQHMIGAYPSVSVQ